MSNPSNSTLGHSTLSHSSVGHSSVGQSSVFAEFDFWQIRANDNKIFTRITWLFLVLTLVFALVVELTQLPQVTRAEREKVPPQLTKIIERIKIEPKPEVKEKPKPEEKVKVEEKPVEKKKPVEVKAKIIDKVVDEKIVKAREQAKNSGLLAMADDLAAMRDMFDLPSPAAALTTQTAEMSAPKVDEVVAFAAKTAAVDGGSITQSGAKNVALVNRDVVALAQKVVFGPADGVAGGTVANVGADIDDGDARVKQRKLESIRLVLDRNKGAFYTIYRRALRKDPSLEGKVTMLIVVEPDGRVSTCDIVSSELDDAKLERKLVARVKMINFGQEVAKQTSISYSFNFLPY